MVADHVQYQIETRPAPATKSILVLSSTSAAPSARTISTSRVLQPPPSLGSESLGAATDPFVF
jgi:hypothetical protein